MKCRDETSFWRTAALRYQHGLSAVFFAEGPAKIAHRGCAILAGFGTFAKAREDIVHSLDYPDSLLKQCFGDFSWSSCVRGLGEDELLAEENRALWSSIINMEDGQRDRSARDAGRARYDSTRAPVMEYLENDYSRV